jgi:hypothetical protein
MRLLADVFSAGWVGSLLGLIGILLACFFYVRSRTRRLVAYQYTAVRLIGSDGALPSAVEVRYEGKPVLRLTRSSIILWNAGNQTVNGADIAQSAPMGLQLADENTEFLSVEVEQVTRAVIGFRAAIDPKRSNIVSLTFDFLDPGDGAVITFLHSANNIQIFGVIKGLPKGFTSYGAYQRRGSADAILNMVSMGVVIFATFSTLISSILERMSPTSKPTPTVVLLAFLVCSVGFWRTARRRCPRSLAKAPSLAVGKAASGPTSSKKSLRSRLKDRL